MDATWCAVSGCEARAAQLFTIDEYGLLVVYAACREHHAEIHRGTAYPVPVDPFRGFVGVKLAA